MYIKFICYVNKESIQLISVLNCDVKGKITSVITQYT